MDGTPALPHLNAAKSITPWRRFCFRHTADILRHRAMRAALAADAPDLPRPGHHTEPPHGIPGRASSIDFTSDSCFHVQAARRLIQPRQAPSSPCPRVACACAPDITGPRQLHSPLATRQGGRQKGTLRLQHRTPGHPACREAAANHGLHPCPFPVGNNKGPRFSAGALFLAGPDPRNPAPVHPERGHIRERQRPSVRSASPSPVPAPAAPHPCRSAGRWHTTRR